MKCLEIKITGRVQGVFFRNFTKKKALKFNIKGSVQNQDDGSVYIVAQGKEDNLEKFLKTINKGPLLSKIESVNTKELFNIPNQEIFEIK